MMLKNNLLTALTSAVLCLAVFTGCSLDGPIERLREKAEGITWVSFINNNEFPASIYSDSSRVNKIAEAGANGQSAAIQTDPNAGGALFFSTFHINIDDAVIDFEWGEVLDRIDAGKTQRQPNTVTIPSLEELDEAEFAKPLTDMAYIKIQNGSSFSLVLRQGSLELMPEGSASSILSGGETGMYIVSPGPVGGYSLTRNVTPVPFPQDITEFAPARIYSFRFDGGLTLLSQKALTLASAFALYPPENINAQLLPSGSISLSWDRTGTETSYRIYRAEGEPENFTLLASTEHNSFTDTEAAIGKTYYYKLTSVKNNIESEMSVNYASAEIAVLAVPTGLKAEAQDTDRIHLSWNTVEGAAGYKIYHGFSPDSINTHAADATSTSHTVTGLEANTGYYFAVRAFNGYSESSPSEYVYEETLEAPPSHYTVAFDSNGGSDIETQLVEPGTPASSPPVPVRAGYTFAGWYSDSALTVEYDFSDPVTRNFTLYAKWNLNRYTVSFIADEGNPAPPEQQVYHDGNIDEPPVMTKSGYTFGGWYREADFVNLWDFESGTVTDNITLYAKWNLNQYTVIFNADGGTPAPPEQPAYYNGNVNEPPVMEKDGYTFGGWYREANFDSLWNFESDTVTNSITLYAKWNLNQYSVSFNTDGGTPAPPVQQVYHGGKINEPPVMEKDSYTFGGWYSEADFDSLWDFESDIVTDDITLYAKWNPNQYSADFNADGGIPAPPEQPVYHGGNIDEPPVMAKNGYTFGGWYKEADFENRWNFESDTVTGNITLYAKWNLNQYAVSFYADGGIPAPSEQQVYHGGNIDEPPVMAKDGYTFDGWHREADFDSPWNFENDTVTGSITLYAKWNLNQYTVSFNADGGIPAPPEQQVYHGEYVNEPPVMTKSGYTFGGWYKEEGFVNLWSFENDAVTGGITLYAKWDVIVPGSGAVNVTFTGPTARVISIERIIANNLSQSDGGSITLNITEDFDRYEWFVGVTRVASGNNITLQADNPAFIAGHNWITAVVYGGSGSGAAVWSGDFMVQVNK